MGKVVERPLDLSERIYLVEIAKGLLITMRHFFVNLFTRKHTVTVKYPEEKRVYPGRFRGKHRLKQREDGSPKCVACMCCATICPAHCIHIVGAEHPDRKIEKYPVKFEIDELRCVVCGLCEEVCPCDAIAMDTGIHVSPVYSREGTYFRKDLLLSFQQDPEAARTKRLR
ncbi:MAG: NADH-quinone oxidoreductase subunit I [Deltaproteobacteria bacterium]|nr:MAG: NADH-quinone oxidoreductase subunit I [Deltaproteobacteria bacterium]